MTYRTIAVALTIVLPLAPGLIFGLQADTRAVYDTPDGEFVVEYRDRDNLRIKWPQEENSFLLVEGGEAYMVSRDDEGWFAIPAEDLARMAGDSEAPAVRVEALGEEVRIAGIIGEKYRLEQGDGWGEAESQEIVLTDDERLRDVSRAFKRLSELFQGAEQDVEVIGVAETDMADMGVLRSEDMELTSVGTESIPDRNFSLPPDTRKRSLGEAAAGASDSGGQASNDSGGEGEGSWLGQQLEETGSEAREEAADSAGEEVREGVREGVKSLFD